MKLYLVCEHRDIHGQAYHRPYAKAYGDTFQDAGYVYFIAVAEKYPNLINLNFCLQEARLDHDSHQYFLEGEIMNINVGDVGKKQITVQECQDYA